MTRSDWLRLCGLSLLWGGSFFFVGVAVPDLPAFTIVWVRVSLGAVTLAVLLPLWRIPYPKGAGVWAGLLVMGIVNNAVPFSLYVFAQGQISSGLAAILNATTPIWSALLAHVATTDQRLTTTRALGVLIGFLGVAVMIGAAPSTDHILAQMACLGAALSYGVAVLWGRRFAKAGVRPLAVGFGQLAMAALVMTPMTFVVDRPWTLAVPDTRVIAALLGLAVFSTALAYGLYFRLLADTGPVNASLVTFLVPLSATLLGIVFLRETLLLRHIAGMALIGLGLAVMQQRLRWRGT